MRIRTYRVLSRSRLGYRGAFLLILAFIDVIYGFWMAHPAPEQLRTQAFIWRDEIMPTQAWGALWIGVGLVIAVNSFLRQDRVGFAFAVGIKIAWAFVALISGFTDRVPGAYTTVTVWLGVAVMAILVSGWPEPVHSHEVTVLQDPAQDSDQGSEQ